MTDAYEEARKDLFVTMRAVDSGSSQYLNAVKALEVLNKAETSHPVPESPEQKGTKAWLQNHSDALIRVGGTFGAIVLIGFVESKFDVIFRSKASKYL